MFLLKPHVMGAEGQVTSPDVIVDAAFLDGARHPMALLTHQCWQEGEAGPGPKPGFALMALGGGALILPVLVMGTGMTVLGRAAWRLSTLDDHVGRVTLNGAALADGVLPATLIAGAGGTGDALPRGYLVVQTAEAEAPSAVLSDPVLAREIRVDLHLAPLDRDRWGEDRPRPRYSVGPTQKDVPHYI